jgi:hypothetical protein
MSKNQLGIIQKEKHERHLQAIRNDLIVRVYNDMLGYGPLSLADIAQIFGWTRASVSRVARFGKNTSQVPKDI